MFFVSNQRLASFSDAVVVAVCPDVIVAVPFHTEVAVGSKISNEKLRSSLRSERAVVVPVTLAWMVTVASAVGGAPVAPRVMVPVTSLGTYTLYGAIATGPVTITFVCL